MTGPARTASPDESYGRRRSSSTTQRVQLQVTVDNEQFAVVDITGTTSAEAIREKMFAKLRFRDEQFPSLAIYQTDIGESLNLSQQRIVNDQHLLNLVHTYGDARASLKFLIRQTSVANSWTSAVVPPSDTFRTSRPGVPPILTNVAHAPSYSSQYITSARHSKDGSLSSVSEAMDRSVGSHASLSDRSMAENSDFGPPSLQNTSSTSESAVYNIDSQLRTMSPPLFVDETPDDESTFRATQFASSLGGSNSASTSRDGLGLDFNIHGMEGMDEETKALIIQMQMEDLEEERRRMEERMRQQVLDEQLALRDQERERSVWQMMQQLQLEQHHTAAPRADHQRLSDDWEMDQHGRMSHFINERQQRAMNFQEMRMELDHVSNMDDRRYSDTGSPYTSTYTTSPPIRYSAVMPQGSGYPASHAYASHVASQARYPADAHMIHDNHPQRLPPVPTRPTDVAPQHPYYDSHMLPGAQSMDNIRAPGGQQQPYRASLNDSIYSNSRFLDMPEPSPSTLQSHDAIVPFPSPYPSYSDPSASDTRPRSSVYPDLSPRSAVTNAPDYLAVAANRQRSTSESRVPASASDFPPPPVTLRRPTQDSISTESSGTAISDSTVRSPDDEATATIQPHWQKRYSEMLKGHGPVSQLPPMDFENPEETVLFLPVGPRMSADANDPRRPSLTVETEHQPKPRTLSASDANKRKGGGVKRVDSFYVKNDDKQWSIRPDPEMLYENLQQFFPEVDLDKPIVDPGVSSIPTTPNSESSPRSTLDLNREPPSQPSRNGSVPSPKADDVFSKPPQHPSVARIAPPPPSATGNFNKKDHRKSIRNITEGRRNMIKRVSVLRPLSVAEEKKLRRSSSLWGHKVVEVTPSRLNLDQPCGALPEAVPESPAAEGQTGTLTWVKGELIGKGSYGRVYIALNVNTGDMMAVKQVELPATENDRNDSRQQLVVDAQKSELALLKDMYHPNIVAYLGCEVSVEHISIFLEYVSGGSIASIYRTPGMARFDEQLVKFFTGQILEGLAYLHGKNIWHRVSATQRGHADIQDLKGDNILVDTNGICKISDFGISKRTQDAYDSFGNATNMRGSIFWMAPEVISSASYSGKVDIWSLGCVVLEMWSSERPWGTFEPFAAMFNLFQKREPPPLPDRVKLDETAFDFLYKKCLASEAAERPMASQLLQHPFLTERELSWTFDKSPVGHAVLMRGNKNMRSASSSTATASAAATLTMTTDATVVPGGGLKAA